MADTEDEHDAPAEHQDDAARDATILVYQSPIVRVNTAESGSLLDIAREQHAFDPTIFDESPPFFWRTVPSTQLIDAYGTRMMDDSLKNFAEDATDGRSFMPAHNIRDMPIGRTVRGSYKNASHKMGKHTEADAYTIPDLELSSVKTNDFIRGVRAGILHDVSIGFYGGEIRCSVCGQNWWSFLGMAFNDCDHFAGMTYKKLDKNGEETNEDVIASGDVYGAHMAEISAVFDGATPGAAVIGILRAERMVDAGRVAPDMARSLEARYRIRLPSQRNWAGADLSRHNAATTPSEEERAMSHRSGEPMDPPESQPAAPASTEVTPPPAPPAPDPAVVEQAEQRGRTAATQSVRTLLIDCHLIESADTRDLTTVLRDVADQHTRLREQASDGVQYRKDLVEDALAEGVRALGEAFKPDEYRSLLDSAAIPTIKRFRDDWKKVGDEKLGSGRRTTDVSGADSQNGRTVEFSPPPSVHRG